MVVIRDSNDCSVFPPINHENLQIFSQTNPQQPSPSFSPSDSETWGGVSSLSPFNSQVRKGGDFVVWMSMGLRILRSKLFSILSSFRNYASNRGAVSSIGVPAATVVMSCWIMMRCWCCLRKWRRRRSLTQNEIRLMDIIKDKDGIIAKLLHQIAQMNGILIARHKALAANVVE